jgi:hypothetical protein
MSERFFCAVSSRQRNEQIFGTAPHVNTWLVVEHFGPWGPKSFPDENLAPAVAQKIQHLASALNAGKRLLVRRHHRREAPFHVFRVRSEERASSVAALSFETAGEFLSSDADEFDARAAPWHGPLYLVCTHGNHDKCCAKFGFATYCAAREAAPDAAWECSHVGGDRFAANLVCFPEAIYYGQVPPDAVATVISEHRAGRIVLEFYRGRSCYGRITQVGEYFVRLGTRLRGIQDLALDSAERVAAAHWRVQFRAASSGETYAVEFRRRDAASVHLLTCHAVEPRRIPEFECLSLQSL